MGYVIGTAGHVDHGKSTLIQRLTGIDPDRLAEEKQRGLTIDLGFAWLRLPSGLTVDIVDVPGHARFVHNMLAGVHGIDAVLLVIAADEGVMPQTREHLAIIDVLEIRRGLVALNKVDLVDDDWQEMVVDDVRQAIAGTSLEAAPIIPVSAVSGTGLDQLLSGLDEQLSHQPERPVLDAPRLPVDRVFTIGGFGTVVTGTLVDGRLRAGAHMELQPSGRRVRVRGVQQHGHNVSQAEPGTRTAANLVGVESRAVTRGEVLTEVGTLVATRRLDASVRVLDDAPTPLRQGAQLILHIGTAEVAARATVLGASEIVPKARGWVQLHLAREIAAAAGDRFVLRRPSPPATVAGGKIVDVKARRHRRMDPGLVAVLERRAAGEALMDELRKYPHGVTERALARTTPIDDQALRRAGARRVESLWFAPEAWAALVAGAADIVSAYHNAHPLRDGMPREELASRLRIPPAVLPSFIADGAVVARGARLALPDHEPRLAEADEQRARQLLGLLAAEPFAPTSLSEAMRRTGTDPELVQALASRGDLIRLNEQVAFTRMAYDQAVAAVYDIARGDGTITVAELRDRLQASRRTVLAFLEYLDSSHITIRNGDVRYLRGQPQPKQGSSARGR